MTHISTCQQYPDARVRRNCDCPWAEMTIGTLSAFLRGVADELVGELGGGEGAGCGAFGRA